MLTLRSELEKKLLIYFFLNPKAEHHLQELARLLQVDPGNLNKKLKSLEQNGLFNSKKLGNLKLYSLNKNFALYNEYKSIIKKTYGIEPALKSALANINGIQEAYLFGSFAKGMQDEFSDIDLLAVGNYDGLDLSDALACIENKLDREINLIEIDPCEFKTRKKIDPFFKNIFKEKIIQLI